MSKKFLDITPVKNNSRYDSIILFQMITNKVIDSFLRCDYKSYLQFNNATGYKREYELLEDELWDLYKNKFYKKLQANPKNQILPADDFQTKIQVERISFVIAPTWQSNKFNIGFDILELVPDNSSSGKITYIPISISPKERVSQLEKLSFVIKCLILKDHGIKPEFGKIIYGCGLKSTKINISSYLKEAKKKLNELIKTVKSQNAPRFYQNKYCNICEFQDACKTKLIEEDDLSLLGSISQREVLKKNNRGIFSIYQLSYTFRPRKKSKKKKAAPKNQRFLWELKALALREQRTYIQDIPKLPESKTEIYLDLEGLPEEGFIYLIGMVVKNDETERCFSFWANSQEEEETIFKQLLDTISKLRDYTVYHYGNYEIRALKRISTNLNSSYKAEVNRIIENSINLLSIFTSIVYPPTYTNGLKDIASFLGFQWSNKNASGLQSIVWRKKWELSGESDYKHTLIQYNLDDCHALKIIKCWLINIEQEINSENYEHFIKSENVKIEEGYTLEYGKINYVFPEYDEVSKYAYFDYQQNKIYLKSNDDIKKAIKRKTKTSKLLNKIDKVIEIYPDKCPVCNGENFKRLKKTSKKTIDLRFLKNGIKKWVTKWNGGCFQCLNCNKQFTFKHLHKIPSYGDNLILWSMNHYIQYRLSYNQILNILSDSFNIRISLGKIASFKSKLAQKYQETYEEIQYLVTEGILIHADETKAEIKDLSSTGYVWVFTNMNSVFYVFQANREADFLHDLLKDFQGVLVSDFYSGYDSIKCKQQKCLVHLIRDLNEDLLKNQLNQEYKNLVYHFGKLLRNIMDTVNQYGLKTRFLKKHQKDVDKFYQEFINIEYATDLAIGYQKRFQKYKDKLFTFLHHDNIPWNNNNAESAIKPFAKYRMTTCKMATSKGIKDYLVLLSLHQTCRYRGISFWEFLKSGEKSIEQYCKKH